MSGIAWLLASAALGHAAARWLRLPVIPFLLAAGFALSRAVEVPGAVLEDGLILGVAFLLFVGGTELNPARLRTQRRAALRVGLIQFAVLAVLGFGAAITLGYDGLTASYLALALTASSTLVGIRLLQRRRQLYEPFGRLVVGVLLLQDLLVITLLPFVTGLPEGWRATARILAGVLLLGGLALAAARWVAPRILAIEDEEEPLLMGAIAALFVFVAVAGLLGVPLVAGAFLAGVALSPFPVNGVIRTAVAPVSDFFTALFFTALGALVGLPTATELMHAAVLVMVVVLATPPLVAFIAERSGLSARPALEAGLLLSQTSEISLVIGLYAFLGGHVTQHAFNVIALVTVFTMLLTPALTADAVVWKLLRLHPAPHRSRGRVPDGGHIVLLGVGSTGLPLLETLLGAGHEVVAVDDDPAIIDRLAAAELPCIRGDASDPDVLRRARVHRARMVVSTLRRPRDNRRVLDMAAGVPVLARVFDEHDAGWIRGHGGMPVPYAAATADRLMEWLDRTDSGTEPASPHGFSQ